MALLMLQIVVFALGTYWRRSVKKTQRVCGVILQVLSLVLIAVYLISLGLGMHATHHRQDHVAPSAHSN